MYLCTILCVELLKGCFQWEGTTKDNVPQRVGSCLRGLWEMHKVLGDVAFFVFVFLPKTADWMQVLSLRTLLSADPQDLRAALSKDPMHVATGKSKSPASFAGTTSEAKCEYKALLHANNN